jgi:hypothetical protein
MKLIDIKGQKFGRLLVLEKDEAPKMWKCVCDCGNITYTTGSNLRKVGRGGLKSCGCYGKEWGSYMGSKKEFIEKRINGITKHGNKRKSGATVEYRTWLNMKRRCYDEKCKDFMNWGGRGIGVCDRWVNDFQAFLDDMGKRPEGNYSIDRIDPNKDYSPENCRWATMQQQGGENRRGLVPVTVNGIYFRTVKHACLHFGVGVSTALQRIYAGIDPAEAVSRTSRLKSRRTRESYTRKSSR